MTTDLLKDIRTQLRLSMNGIVSQSMREKGIHYKMNFGVDILKLRKISQGYAPCKELAEALWRQDVRELKILATMLYPDALFLPETADAWVHEIPYQEIREQVCMNLFQKLPFADVLVARWVASDDESVRTTGYWLFARLIIARAELTVKKIDVDTVIRRAIDDVCVESVFLRQAALGALRFAGRNTAEKAREILCRMQTFNQSSSSQVEREIYESLRFEFGE